MAGRPQTRQADDPSFQVTTRELARLLGTNENRIGRLRARGLPTVSTSRYRLDEVIAWLLADQGTGLNQEDVTLSDAKRDLAVSQKAKIDIEAAKMRNELLPLEEVKHLLMALSQILVSGIEALPARCGDGQAELEDKLEDECRLIRDQIAGHVRRFEADYRPLQ